MKRTALLLSLLAAVFMTGCSQSPKDTTTAFFKELTAGNFESTSKYTEIPLPIFEDEVPPMEVYFKSMTASNIKEIENNGDTAIVAVDLSAVDLLPIVISLMETAPPENIDEMSSEELEELFNTLFIEGISAPDAARKTLTAELNLRKLDKDGKKRWVILVDEALFGALNLQDPSEVNEAYEDSFGYNDEPPFEHIGTETTRGKYMGSDDMAELCSFIIDGDLYHMYCDDDQIDDLNDSHLEKEVDLTYDIFGLAEYDLRVYVLVTYN